MDDKLLDLYRGTDGVLLAYFQMEYLQPINYKRMRYWDEACCKCRVGATGSRDTQNVYIIIFTQNEQNNFDMKGTFDYCAEIYGSQMYNTSNELL